MGDIVDIRRYVTEHIDEAIEKEDIKIYYQPIIRAMTGEVCGKEALARWDDPVYGLMMPEQFIPVLEEYKLIYKLDSFVIKKVCAHYNHCAGRKDPLTPISFNLSWLDFELCDIISILNKEVEENRIPRQMIRVEINERLISHDRELIKNKIKQLHEEGYDIVMDDFGSGHSSINILKDYVFDELKIDMRLLWGDDDRSKKIIEYLCSMAKSLNLTSTAEGVETREQIDFLNRAGCEKMQGFYFGKPMFYWDLVPFLREKGLTAESLGEKEYYDTLGGIDVREKSNTSYALIEYCNKSMRFLYINDQFRMNLSSLDINTFDFLDRLCNDQEYNVNFKFANMLKRAREKKKEQVIDFVWNGDYCIGKVNYLAGTGKKDACEAELINLSMDSRVNHLEKINDALDGVFSIFDRVALFDQDKDLVTTLYKDTEYVGQYEGSSYSANVAAYIKQEIYPEDRERYRQFIDPKTIRERIRNSGRSFISGCFRFRTENGNYAWKEQFIIMERSHDGEKRFLNCIMNVDEKQLALLMELSSIVSTGVDNGEHGDDVIEDEDLWRSAVESFPVGIFWKDRERRFLGVNKTFLDYYGFESEAEVIGKTDEDMNWHVDPVPFKSDEERVIGSGEVINNVVGKCIARGENRDIIVNKAPIHKNGNIVGLVGYFRDVTERTSRYENARNASITDPVTGVLNIRGLMESVASYREAYEENNMDFAMIAIHIHDYRDIREEFGKEHMDRIMKVISERLLRMAGNTAVIGRPGNNLFLIVRQVEKKEEGPSLMQNISNEIRSIREVDGRPCTIYTSAGYAAYSECGSAEALYSATMKRMNDQMERMRRFTGGY